MKKSGIEETTISSIKIYKAQFFRIIMEKITPYKQTLTHSCLVADLLMLLKYKYKTIFNKEDEKDIANLWI